ncbi:MAG: hypothetical protein IPI00_17720 [Flavobacteriales bacterium]|nr:hypothetical protein [Flavobacteriales bacterium]
MDKLEELIATTGLDPARCAYMGDDIPDLRVLQRVAFACCPSDAAEEVKAICNYEQKQGWTRMCARCPGTNDEDPREVDDRGCTYVVNGSDRNQIQKKQDRGQ